MDFKAYQKKWQAANRDAINARRRERYTFDDRRESLREWRVNNPDKCLEYKRKYIKNNPEKVKKSIQEWRYRDLFKGTPPPRPDRCDVCKKVGKVVVDHCHRTLLFRGWLCNGCNSALGHAKDDPNILRALAEYLA